MEELEELRHRLETERPTGWEELPDISLYMDQVIGYMPRQLIQYGEGERLTSAMVNNYIKDGLLPRAEGKRYSREHLSRLTAICALKQVLPVRDAGLLSSGVGESGPEAYAFFLSELDRALKDTAQQLDPQCEEADLPALALSLALRSYANKLACQRVLELLRARRPQAGRSKKSRKDIKT